MTKQKRDYPFFGDVYYAELTGGQNIQSGVRPVVIAQNNIGNKHSPTVEVIPMSSKIHKAKYLPTHVLIHPTSDNGLKHPSLVLAEQAVTINKSALVSFLGVLDPHTIQLIGQARRIQSPFLLG